MTAWGDGSSTRESLYVEDTAEGILPSTPLRTRLTAGNATTTACRQTLRLRSGQALGNAFEISIKDLTETIARLCGFQGRITWDTTKQNDQPRHKLDTSRADAVLGFEAATPFQIGLRRTIG
jgi:GDP-L-fucose synthase